MIDIYILVLGIFLAVLGGIEQLFPLRAFSIWQAWVRKKFFFLHGTILIAGGFPLTIYKGPLSTLIFIIGLLAVLTGPFVLIYPEKIRSMFNVLSGNIKETDIKKIIFVEGALRISAGMICIASYLLR